MYFQDVTAGRDINIVYDLPPAEAAERRNLALLLSKVKAFWIDGLLAQTRLGGTLFELDKENVPELVANPWRQAVELPEAGGQTIVELFVGCGRSFLILGEPGSGKTTALLQLAQDLIRQAEKDPTQPVPVVFHLSTWNGQSFADWLAQELNGKYQVPRRLGQMWLEQNRLLLFLDGLDEVRPEHRAACVAAINGFVRDYGVPGVAVCSRRPEYEALNVRLAAGGAVHLRPLTPEQIEWFLAQRGPELAALRTVLCQDDTLREQARSPLMLDIMSRAYSGMPTEALRGLELSSVEARRDHLFNTYVERVFQRKGECPAPYDKTRTLHWLSWLARQLKQRGHTEFLLEDLQPDWLSRGGFGAYLLLCGLVFGLVVGLFAALYWSLITQWNEKETFLAESIASYGWSSWLFAGPVWALLVLGLDAWLAARRPAAGWRPNLGRTAWRALLYLLLWTLVWVPIWQFFWYGDPNTGRLTPPLITGLLVCVFVAVWGHGRPSLSREIRPVEALGWSWPGVPKGFLGGLVGGVCLWALWYVVNVLPDHTWNRATARGLALHLGLMGGAIGAVTGGFRGRVLEAKAVPNQGILLSIRNGVITGTVGFVVIGGSVTGALYLYQTEATLFGISLGAIVAVILALYFGIVEAGKHYILRAILWSKGRFPWRCARLLDYASERILLRKVGGGYLFVHRLLLEYFANPRHERPGR